MAEDADADSYRDLLHEIDRAFDGFERSAVRHGWMGDQGLSADAADSAGGEAANVARLARERIDLPAFVAAAIARRRWVW